MKNLELIDALGIGRFAVVGPSGGGPYTAACAHKLPERVIAAGLVSCSAPYLPDRRSDVQPAENTEGLDEEAIAARSLSWPEFLNWFTEHQGSTPPNLEETMASFADWLPECDKQVLALPEVQATFRITFPNAFRQGIAGWAWDSWTLVRPWGFHVEDIQVPTYVWHGELDQAIPVENGRYLAAIIPNCQATFYPDRGHLLPPQDWEAIYTALVGE
jgi:pimeloyl-ACP methyl ester carboxylesterase